MKEFSLYTLDIYFWLSKLFQKIDGHVAKHVVSSVGNLNPPLSSSCKNSLDTSFPSPGSPCLYAKNPAMKTTLCFKASVESRSSCVFDTGLLHQIYIL